ncbi:MAG: Fe-S cluster assembly protein SufD [Candidatus Thiodiazotropha sp. (ex Dulcina madagascariensis)]|nr:Fe-S cluster assembly protein SufD [Candidatus Thiodiazotropha sp. (ex Dulcina madagascariensis)]MCU7927370.1 Fe-S cluster assembly protein SufD [Candidatus Thiodiazotropha sp. (ex Dulcina madagascariensis)]
MNQLIRHYQQTAMRYIDSLHGSDGDWLIGRRQAAARRFAELGFPHSRTEAWRYTGIEGLMRQGFELTDRFDAFPRHAVMRRFLREPTAARLVFVDGLYQADLSDTGLVGVRVGSLREAMAVGDRQVLEAVGSLSGLGDHGFEALNFAALQDGAVIRVSAGVTVQQPIELLHLAGKGAAGRAMCPRHLVMLEADASANLVERYLALDGETAYFNNLVCEITLAERASLVHQRIQQESAQAYHLCDIHLGLQGEADYQGINAAVGGAWSRTRVHCRFAEPGANCELDGLYLAGEGQLTDFHLDLDHAVPHCDSRENFKGILHGGGKAVFDGLIQVREQAQGSNAHLSNANLMLSRRAEVDAKPQLLIHADDVQCSHGASIGQLDDQAIFYLRSRGFDEGQARRLLCQGFANEIVERFQSASLREQLSEVIGQRLEE